MSNVTFETPGNQSNIQFEVSSGLPCGDNVIDEVCVNKIPLVPIDRSVDIDLSEYDRSLSDLDMATAAHGAELLRVNSRINTLAVDSGELQKTASAHSAELVAVNGKVTTHATEIFTLKGQMAAKAEQAQIDQSISNLQIGGRNLLKKSDVHYENASYPTAIYDFGNEKLDEGETCTIQIKGQLGEGKSFFGIYNSSGNVCSTSLYPSDQKNGIYTKTFKWVVGGTANTKLYFFPIPNTVTTTSTIEWIKLERGNKATDWTSAPEDIVEVVTAQSTALTVANGKITALITESTQTKTSVAELTDKISIDQQTKLNGVELLPQDYRTDPKSKALLFYLTGLPAELVPVEGTEEYQYRTTGKTRLNTDYIPFNPENPFYISAEVFYEPPPEAAAINFYVGVEFFDKNKVSAGSNDLCAYAIIAAPTANKWLFYEGFARTDATHRKAKYMRLRILTRRNETGSSVTYLKNIHFKQLGANQAVQIAEMSDQYSSTVADINSELVSINARLSQLEAANIHLEAENRLLRSVLEQKGDDP